MIDDLRQRIDAAMVQFFGEPCSDTFKSGLVEAAVSAFKPELDELLRYRNAIAWETSCLSCSRILDNARAREEELEQQIDASLSKQYAALSRIDQERAKLPAEERQRLEAGDAPLLRIQLLHMLERARKAERAVNLLADVHRRAEHAEAAGENEQAGHAYLSTGCLHGEHGYCQAHTGLSGAKTPGQCKFCGAKCQCPCHGSTTAKEA